MFPLLHTFFFFFFPYPKLQPSHLRPPLRVQPLTARRSPSTLRAKDGNISTQAISLPGERAAQTTLYFRKLRVGSTARETVENLIYLKPFDVLVWFCFFSLFSFHRHCGEWSVISARVGHAGLEGYWTVSSRVATSLLALFPKHCHPSTGNKSTFAGQTVSCPPCCSAAHQ